MIGFRAYEMHTALNLHFSGKYDFFKYGGKTRLKPESFETNQFKWQYANFEKKYEQQLLMFYLIYKRLDFPGYIPPKALFVHASKLHSKKVYDGTNSNILVGIENDLERILKHSSTLFDQDGVYPKLYTMYLNTEIELETLLLIDRYVHRVFTKENSLDIIAWKGIIDHMMMVQPFVLSLIPKHEFVAILNQKLPV